MRSRTRDEAGYALVIAIVFLGIMLTIGVAALAFVNGETQSSGRERVSESRLNLSEGALTSELYELTRQWPNSTALPDCTEASSGSTCPTPAQLNGHFSGADFTLNPQWTIQVRDDASGANGSCSSPPGPGFYSDATILPLAHYDANNNCVVWVRAEAVLKGVKRVVVAQARAEYRAVAFPAAPFVAGSMDVSNNGVNKTLVDGAGQAGVVRCADPTNTACVYYRNHQVDNPASVTADPNQATTVLDPATLAGLKRTAQANGTYYTSCPSDPSGAVVYVEGPVCAGYTSRTMTVNASTQKGIFILANGTLTIGGNVKWYGAIYALNQQNSSGTVVSTSGTPEIHGGIFIDGPGNLDIGSSGDSGSNNADLIYDPSVFTPVGFYGTADVVQNTWRELTPG